ncbi:MAG: hypothetical protein WCO98_07960 [bacterium]
MNDITIVRELAKQYLDICSDQVYQERRALWTRKNSLQKTRPLIIASFGMWNVWCQEVFGDHAMQCSDPFYREQERFFKMKLFQHEIGDDQLLDPWITLRASLTTPGWDNLWGVHTGTTEKEFGGSWQYDPPLKNWDDMAKLKLPHHGIDEEATRQNINKLQDALGDIITINIDRGPACLAFMSDISTMLCKLRGLEQVMIDMYESPEELHQLLAFMRDGILTNHNEAEAAGDFSLTDSSSQEPFYCDDMEILKPNSGTRKINELWGFAAAQEFTLISPDMHDEFMLQYQMPIYRRFKHTSYGCCENLTNKIDILRQLPNLRVIAVAPTADVGKCAEQIKDDYVFSWRPNPTDMVCCGWNESAIKKTISEGCEAAKDCHLVIHLKDIETVEGDPTRLRRWVELVRSVTNG